jgi:hypothetical protein
MNMKSIQRKLLKTVIAGVPIPRADTEYGTFDTPVSGEPEEVLHAELQLLKLMPLRARALEGGVPEDAVNEAMEADNPKAALVELVEAQAAQAASADAISEVLRTLGGNGAAGALVAVLELAAGALDALSTSAPRQTRKAALELLERVESLSRSACTSAALSFYTSLCHRQSSTAGSPCLEENAAWRDDSALVQVRRRGVVRRARALCRRRSRAPSGPARGG